MKGYFKNKKVIVTGHGEKKGIWLTDLLTSWEADVVGVAVSTSDNDTVFEVPSLASNVRSYLVDLNGTNELVNIFSREQPDIVFHIATNPTQSISERIPTTKILEAIQHAGSVQSAIVIPGEDKSTADDWNASLNEEEKKLLAQLLERVDNVEIRGEIWHQLVKKFITVPIELCILDENDKVFLVYRKDREFDGYHMPGTVVNDWETVAQACKRLVESEVVKGAGFEITNPEPIGWLEVRRGTGPEENPTRNAISLLHIARLRSSFSPKTAWVFSPLTRYQKTHWDVINTYSGFSRDI